MKSSYWIAAGFALTAGAWILSGQFGGETPPAQPDGVASAPVQEAALPRVQVRPQSAEPLVREIAMTGRTEANRKVILRAETEGRIEAIGQERGAFVREGDVIARIALDERRAQLDEARALLRQRQIEHDAAAQLAEKQFRSRTGVAEAKAALDAARAAVARVEVDIAKTALKAPFDGILDERPVEKGDFVKSGDAVATVVDLDPALVVAQLSERHVDALKDGQIGRARLLDGREVEGVVRFVAAVADTATRTFRVELEVPNPDRLLVEGVTAQMRLPLDSALAHRISPASLTLGEDGSIGVKGVGADGVVVFHPVEIVEDRPDAIWIAGPPDRFDLIVVGQEYVRHGTRVEPVPAPAPAAPES